MNAITSALRSRAAEVRAELESRHQRGESAAEIALAFADAADRIVLDAWRDAWMEISEADQDALTRQIALVAVGGFGRRELAPFSDVDLLVVLAPKLDARIDGCVRQMIRTLWDAGLSVGQNVAEVKQLLKQCRQDGMLGTGLLTARLLWGSEDQFRQLQSGFESYVSKTGAARLERQILAAQKEEHERFGATAHLLEPNVKRSSGGLRDIQVVAWLGQAKCGTMDFVELERLGRLGAGDAATLLDAHSFLLQLRAELHFHAGKAADDLSRQEQLRIALAWNYAGAPGVLPVEQFMRDCLRRTTAVEEILERFLNRTPPGRSWRGFLGTLSGKNAGNGFQVHAERLELSDETRESLVDSMEKILEAAAVAAQHNAGFDPATIEALRRRYRPEAKPAEIDGETRPTTAVAGSFLRLLSKPRGLQRILRQLHSVGVLGRLIPQFEHVRCLIQFNAYHKYTVDEHTLVMVGFAEALADPAKKDPAALAYRRIARKDLFHLAILVHDLGKGLEEDHTEVGVRIAQALADRFALSSGDRRTLVLLVHKHLLLSRLAFQRDTRDEAVLVQLVRAVGREEHLQMLYALTVVDVMAVSPEAYTQWKAELLADLYHRACAWFGQEVPEEVNEADERRREILAQTTDAAAKAWILSLPTDYLRTTPAEEMQSHLASWRKLDAEKVVVTARYGDRRDTVTFTVMTHEGLTDGVFHKICGALAAHQLEVLAAQIHTLADGTVLDLFEVRDLHHTGPTSPDRQARISATVRKVLLGDLTVEDALWSNRSSLFVSRRRVIAADAVRIEIDDASSPTCTIVDVFASDRRGLLYTLARGIFRLGLSLKFAKIATYEDEVVDVFYVQERDGEKVDSEERAQTIRESLDAAVEQLATDPRSVGF